MWFMNYRIRKYENYLFVIFQILNFAWAHNNGNVNSSLNSQSVNNSSKSKVIYKIDKKVNEPKASDIFDNRYQIITICNHAPSILKCQNKEHYLILHKIIYGISNSSIASKGNDEPCIQQQTTNINCMQTDDTDKFNCTGSNICIFYPENKILTGCYNQIESNLTQVHIICVNSENLKNYHVQKKKNTLQIDSQSDSNNPISNNKTTTRSFTTMRQAGTTRVNKIAITSLTSLTKLVNTTVQMNTKIIIPDIAIIKQMKKDIIIFIVTTIVSSILVVILFLLVYYRIRSKIKYKRSLKEIYNLFKISSYRNNNTNMTTSRFDRSDSGQQTLYKNVASQLLTLRNSFKDLFQKNEVNQSTTSVDDSVDNSSSIITKSMSSISGSCTNSDTSIYSTVNFKATERTLKDSNPITGTTKTNFLDISKNLILGTKENKTTTTPQSSQNDANYVLYAIPEDDEKDDTKNSSHF